MFGRLIVIALMLATLPVSPAVAQSSATVQDLNRRAMAAMVELELDQANTLLAQALTMASREHPRGNDYAVVQMSLGILAISGHNDEESGFTHFVAALDTDPTVRPDPALSTPEIQRVFAAAQARVAASRGASSRQAPAPVIPDATTSVAPTPAAVAAASVDAPSELPAPEPTTPSDATDRPVKGRRSRLHVHSIGGGYHGVFFTREGGGRFGLSGPTIAYDYFVGKKWGFMLHGEAWFPLSARQTSDNGAITSNVPTDYPAQHYGFDGILMAARRIELGSKLVLTAAVGAHTQAFVLRSVVYSPVELITLGLGGLGKLDWNVNRWFSLHAQVVLGLDPLDAIKHDHPAPITLTYTGAIGGSFRF